MRCLGRVSQAEGCACKAVRQMRLCVCQTGEASARRSGQADPARVWSREGLESYGRAFDSFFFFFNVFLIYIRLFFYFFLIFSLAALGLSCSTRDLRSGMFSCGVQTLTCSMWTLSYGMHVESSSSGIEPGPPALGVWSLTPWTTREVLAGPLILFYVQLKASGRFCRKRKYL